MSIPVHTKNGNPLDLSASIYSVKDCKKIYLYFTDCPSVFLTKKVVSHKRWRRIPRRPWDCLPKAKCPIWQDQRPISRARKREGKDWHRSLLHSRWLHQADGHSMSEEYHRKHLSISHCHSHQPLLPKWAMTSWPSRGKSQSAGSPYSAVGALEVPSWTREEIACHLWAPIHIRSCTRTSRPMRKILGQILVVIVERDIEGFHCGCTDSTESSSSLWKELFMPWASFELLTQFDDQRSSNDP